MTAQTARACPVQFRCLGNHSALTLKPHQKQTYLFRARSYIAIQGVLLVTSEREARSEFLLIYTKNLSMSGRPAGRPWSRF